MWNTNIRSVTFYMENTAKSDRTNIVQSGLNTSLNSNIGTFNTAKDINAFE